MSMDEWSWSWLADVRRSYSTGRDSMMETRSPNSLDGRAPGWAQPRVWHFGLLVLFVAIAITDLREQRISEPVLIALAAGGLALYGLIGWIGWWAIQRFRARFGPILLFMLYAVAMGALFLLATVIYLVIAHVYRSGRF